MLSYIFEINRKYNIANTLYHTINNNKEQIITIFTYYKIVRYFI